MRDEITRALLDEVNSRIKVVADASSSEQVERLTQEDAVYKKLLRGGDVKTYWRCDLG